MKKQESRTYETNKGYILRVNDSRPAKDIILEQGKEKNCYPANDNRLFCSGVPTYRTRTRDRERQEVFYAYLIDKETNTPVEFKLINSYKSDIERREFEVKHLLMD